MQGQKSNAATGSRTPLSKSRVLASFRDDDEMELCEAKNGWLGIVMAGTRPTLVPPRHECILPVLRVITTLIVGRGQAPHMAKNNRSQLYTSILFSTAKLSRSQQFFNYLVCGRANRDNLIHCRKLQAFSLTQSSIPLVIDSITPCSRQKCPAPSKSIHLNVAGPAFDSRSPQAFRRRLAVKLSMDPQTARVGHVIAPMPVLLSMPPFNPVHDAGGTRVCANGGNTGDMSRYITFTPGTGVVVPVRMLSSDRMAPSFVPGRTPLLLRRIRALIRSGTSTPRCTM
jgi:hypothetical protein